jgi:adenosylhomocysteine nucleosidase
MEEELDILRSRLALLPVPGDSPWGVWRSGDGSLLATICGIGKVNAAACLSYMLSHFDIDRVIGIGVAGGIGDDLELGDIVICRDAVQHDFDVSMGNCEKGFIPRLNVKVFTADERLINSTQDAAREMDTAYTIRPGRALSGDQFVASEHGLTLRTAFGGDCVDMETAAWAHVAHLYRVPWMAIRSISDHANSNAPVDFDAFLKTALDRMTDLAEEMLKRI